MRTIRGTLAALAAGTLLSAVGIALPAAAADEVVSPQNVSYITSYTMENKRTISTSHARLQQQLARCQVAANGATCSINVSTNATRSIDLALGASRSWVSGQLGISASSSISTGVQCNSPALNSGQRWQAHPVGTLYSYQIRKKVTQVSNGFAQVTENSLSGTLSAFNPRANDIYCRLG